MDEFSIPSFVRAKMTPALVLQLLHAAAEGTQVTVLIHFVRRAEPSVLDSDEGDRLERRRKKIAAHSVFMEKTYGSLMKKIAALGVSLTDSAGKFFTTIVVIGTPDQIVSAVSLDEIERASENSPMELLATTVTSDEHVARHVGSSDSSVAGVLASEMPRLQVPE